MAYKLKTGQWRGTVTNKGKRLTKVCASRKEAVKWENETRKFAELPMTLTASLGYIANVYLDFAKKRCSTKTYQSKRRAVMACIEKLGPDILFANIDRKSANEVLQDVEDSCSANQANVVRKELSHMWNWASETFDEPIRNPFQACKKLAHDVTPHYAPPKSDFWSTYRVASYGEQTLLLFLYYTGARISEALSLRWSEVNLEDRKVALASCKTGGKGRRFRFVPLEQHLAQRLEKLYSSTDSEFVFTNPRTGKPYSSQQYIMQKLCEKAGVRPFGFHGIRALCATTMSYAGSPLPVIQNMLRHSSIATTARYIRNLGVTTDEVDRVFGHKE